MVRSFFIAIFFGVTIISVVAVTMHQSSLAKSTVSKKTTSTPIKHDDVKQKSIPKAGLEVGNIAPDIMLMDLNDDTVKLSDYRGKKVILNFWATWCPPCKEEIPQLVQFYKKAIHDQVVILGVDMASMEEGGPQSVKTFAKNQQMTFPILLDNQGDAAETYGILTIPTTYLIDEHGVILAKHIGPITGDWIEKTFNKKT